MFGPYLKVLRRPGAARFSGAGLLARLQLSMAGLSAVLLVSAVRDSYALAGIISAIYSIAAAVVGPQASRLIDGFGQRRVVPFQLLFHVPAIAGMITIAVTTSLNWPIFALALVAGAAQPSVGALVRARWAGMLTNAAELRTAYAWESLGDELVFIIGPPLATVLSVQLFPAAGLTAATVLLVVGTVLLIVQTRTEPVPAGAQQARHGRPAILLPGVAGMTLIFVLLGGLFGSFEVTTVAFAKEHGVGEAAGVILALYSFGSLLAGFAFGAIAFRASLLRQFGVAVSALAVVSSPLAFLPTVTWVGAGLFVAGLACSPVLISGTALMERIVPTSRLTETMSWNSSGMSVGIAVFTPLAGYLIDAHGASTAYLVSSGCALGAFLVAALVFPSLRKAQAGAVRRGHGAALAQA